MSQFEELLPSLKKLIEDKNGQDLVCMPIKNPSIASLFVIVTCTSSRHMHFLSEAVSTWGKKEGYDVRSSEGTESGWKVVDMGEAMVHLFLKEKRQHYNLEKLWQAFNSEEQKG